MVRSFFGARSMDCLHLPGRNPEPKKHRLPLAQQAEQQMNRLDHAVAHLTGFAAGKKDNAARLFRVKLKHISYQPTADSRKLSPRWHAGLCPEESWFPWLGEGGTTVRPFGGSRDGW